MLIEFKVSNFRSIRQTQSLSMVAGSGREHLDSNTFVPKLPGVERLVRSAVMYGPNAAGKTNVLYALQFLKNLVMSSAATQQGIAIPHVPFKFSKSTREAPGVFDITFSQDGVLYQYKVTVSSARVHSEELLAYPKNRPQRLYRRTYLPKKDSYEWSFSANLTGKRSIWRDATRNNALFLSTAVQLNNLQLIPIFEWFQKRLVIVVGASQMNSGLTLKMLDDQKGKESLLFLMQAADFSIVDLEIQREPLLPGTHIVGTPIIEHQSGSPSLSAVHITSFHALEDSDERIGLAISEESNGTQAMFRSAGAWFNVLKNGEVLLVDEIDTSFHPLLTRHLVKLFHSSDANPHNAQLVFNTHDTSLLDTEVFRRDQVWFVEKDPKGSSHVYPLSEFQPRKDEVIGRGYLRGRYGALPIISEVQP